MESEYHYMIKKPCIIVTSLGRTGTKYFAYLFGNIISDSTSLHEPDYINFGQYKEVSERAKQVFKQIHEVGAKYLIFKKLIGQWNLRAISDARILGNITHSTAVEKVINQREEFVNSRPGSIYIESSSAYYGLVDVITDVYENHNSIFLVRDGRSWVSSMINFSSTTMYTQGLFRRLISPPWPMAEEIINDPYSDIWSKMSTFEKLCWSWSKFNQYALDTVEMNPNSRVFRFEDIFELDHRYKNLKKLVRFATTFSNIGSFPTGDLGGVLEHKIHNSKGEFPIWENWPEGYKQSFIEICGPLMEKLNYDI